MAFIGLNVQMDFCATTGSLPNTNGYHRPLQNAVDPDMGELIMCEKDFTSRKRSHPDQFTRSTACGMNSAENEGVEEWGRAVPEQAKRICLEYHPPSSMVPELPTHTVPSHDGVCPTAECSRHTGNMNSNPTKHRRLQLCALSENGGCCHFQVPSLSVIDCPRCLAGEPGHLTHISGSQCHSAAMDTS